VPALVWVMTNTVTVSDSTLTLSNDAGIRCVYNAHTEPRIRRVVSRTLVCDSAASAADLASEIRAWGFEAKAWGISVDC